MKQIVLFIACIFTLSFQSCYEESFVQTIEPKTGWEIKNPDLSATFGMKEYFTDVYFLNDNTGWVIGQSGIILKTTDGGMNWQSIRCPEIDQYGIIHFTNEKEGWAIGNNRNLMHSIDGGLTWQKKSYPGPEYGTSQLHGLTFNSTGKGAFLGAYCDLMLTEDNGQTWSTQRFGEDRYIDDHFSSVSITDNNHIWISGQRRISLDKYIGIMLYSSDGGETWEEKQFDSLNPFGKVFFINNLIGWMKSTNSTLLYTRDGGRNWEKQNTNTTEAIVDFHFTDEMNGWLIENMPNVRGGSEHYRVFKIAPPLPTAQPTFGFTKKME